LCAHQNLSTQSVTKIDIPTIGFPEPCEFCLIRTELTRQTSWITAHGLLMCSSDRAEPRADGIEDHGIARLTMTSIDGVSANIANARLTMSCRVGNCGNSGAPVSCICRVIHMAIPRQLGLAIALIERLTFAKAPVFAAFESDIRQFESSVSSQPVPSLPVFSVFRESASCAGSPR
jgi:hypothetical protein